LTMTTQMETVPLLVTLGHVGGSGFVLRFPVEYSDEVLALLDENNIGHNTAMELSADQPLWLEVVEVLAVPGTVTASLGALGSVIKTLVKRHDGKRFVLKRDEFEVEASGYSEEAVERFLEQRVRDQAKLDAETRRVLGIPDEDAAE